MIPQKGKEVENFFRISMTGFTKRWLLVISQSTKKLLVIFSAKETFMTGRYLIRRRQVITIEFRS